MKKYIQTLSKKDLIDIENDINSWKCPVLLKYKMPITYFVLGKNKNPLPRFGIKRWFLETFLIPIKDQCVFILTKKEILRYHNVFRIKSMSGQEFEKWWVKNKS